MALVSKAQICNLALAHIKQTETTIANLDTDSGNIADQCRAHYDVARKFVLADHNWNFTTKRVALADIGLPTPAPLWLYRYDYPQDCLKVREIQRLAKADVPVPFEIELDDNDEGLAILTDMPEATGIYTKDVEKPELFSPGFVIAFGWYLASELAPALSGDENAQEATLTVYRNLISAGQATDSGEGQADPEHDSPWEQARIG